MPYLADLGYVSNEAEYQYHSDLADAQERYEEEQMMRDIDFEISRKDSLRKNPVIVTFELESDDVTELMNLDDCNGNYSTVTVRELDSDTFWYEIEYSTDEIYQVVDMIYDDLISSRELIEMLSKASSVKYSPLPR